MSWSPQAESLWAKTGESPGDWLSLVRHLMDSAEVAPFLWDRWLAPGVRNALDEALDLQGEGAVLLAWLAGVHDLGKATPFFQSQLMHQPGMESFADRVADAGLSPAASTAACDRFPHSVASAAAIRRWLPVRFPGITRGGAAMLAAVAGAHHGLPAREQEMTAAASILKDDWVAVQDEILDGMTRFTGAAELLERLSLRRMKHDHLMQLTALVIMSDWIASNQELFPLTVPRGESSHDRARMAWERLDLAGSWITRPLPEGASAAYADRFGWPDGRRPWPVQEEVLQAARSLDGPGLICVEAPMGVGKTEAALLAADILAQRTGRHGVMVAAPTMATTDALFTRVRDWAERAGGTAVPASMFLAHSKANLNESVTELPQHGLGVRAVAEDDPHSRGSVVAHQWLVGRKKGLLANIAVGTVDQVLFMALQSKHVMLRHLALASKVVVIDEVHAYDAYMSRYLARALCWLGAYGTPVILLSATLPQSIKKELVAAYASGLRQSRVRPDAVPDSGDEYPVLTVADRQGITAVTSPPSGRRHRVRVRPMGDGDAELLAMMGRVAEDGGCLLVVCSTVARAQHAYALAKTAVAGEARLLHARFTAADRLERERELLAELGPSAHRGTGRPKRRIVVATQVVEQSLDLDFDAMITDVAPVDLILQRCGRVHRHDRSVTERPVWAHEPLVHIRGLVTPGSEDEAPEFEDVQTLVYPKAALMAAAGVLDLHTDGRQVALPSDIPLLVGRAYGDDPALPQSWQELWASARDAWEDARAEQRSLAATFLLPKPRETLAFEQLWPTDGGDVDTPQGEARGQAQVRDADPTIEVLLTREAAGGYRPAAAEAESEVLAHGRTPSWWAAQTLASSALRLPRRFSQPWVFDRALEELERATDTAWQESPLLKGQLQLHLDETSRASIAGTTLRYDPELGLTEEKA